jgi:hypothetical protein
MATKSLNFGETKRDEKSNEIMTNEHRFNLKLIIFKRDYLFVVFFLFSTISNFGKANFSAKSDHRMPLVWRRYGGYGGDKIESDDNDKQSFPTNKNIVDKFYINFITFCRGERVFPAIESILFHNRLYSFFTADIFGLTNIKNSRVKWPLEKYSSVYSWQTVVCTLQQLRFNVGYIFQFFMLLVFCLFCIKIVFILLLFWFEAPTMISFLFQNIDLFFCHICLQALQEQTIFFSHPFNHH